MDYLEVARTTPPFDVRDIGQKVVGRDDLLEIIEKVVLDPHPVRSRVRPIRRELLLTESAMAYSARCLVEVRSVT